MRAGKLILLPTPIGNLDDMTLRGIKLLRECDVIACEDTRHTSVLLQHYRIHKPLLSYHKFNEQERSHDLLDRVESGQVVVLVSDAGMPGISDPGTIVLREAQKRGLPYTVLPGPSAAVTAYVASGIGDGSFLFYGFLPRKGKERRAVLEELDHASHTALIYEAPHRIRKSLQEFGKRWPDREMALAREWTKKYEELIRFSGKEAGTLPVEERGEFVLILGPQATDAEAGAEDFGQLCERVATRAEAGASSRDAVKEVAQEQGVSKNELYRSFIEWKRSNS